MTTGEDMIGNEVYLMVKLISGDTVMATVLTDSDKTVLVTDAFQVNSIVKESNGSIVKATFYSEWFVGAKSKMSLIRKEHIISAAIPDDKTKREYAELVKVQKEKVSAAATKKPVPKPSSGQWPDLDFKFPKDQDRFNN
jgi:hypothetical protein